MLVVRNVLNKLGWIDFFFFFFKLYEMLQKLRRLKSTRKLLVDEQVTMFLYIISHHLKKWVIKYHFKIWKIISKSFHNVLNAVMHLQGVLFKKPKPILVNFRDPKWKWFKVNWLLKNCGSVKENYNKWFPQLHSPLS